MNIAQPETCKTNGHSIIDTLVEANGDWTLKFLYNRFGYHVLMMLPNFCVRDEETEENTCIEELADGIDEEIYILDKFLRENPNTPFIVVDYCLDSCVTKMKEKLESLIVEENGNLNLSKFNEEYQKFELFLKAVRNIEMSGTDAVFDAYYAGWQKYIDK